MKVVNDQHPHLLPPRTCVHHSPAQVRPRKRPAESVANIVSITPFTAAILIIALQLVTHSPSAGAVDLKGCGTRLLEQQTAASNVTNSTESSLTLRITYEQCLVECGSGMGDINWQAFSPNFGAWLLPWITLMFQIPFGAESECCWFIFESR